MSRPDVSEERRPQIVEAAIRVFARKGFRKATMPDIAAEAGLSVGGVYWYYKGKDEIVSAILERAFDEDFGALAELLSADAPAAGRLLTFVAAYADSFDQWLWMNPIGAEFYGEAAHDENVRAVILRYLGRFRQALAALIGQGIQAGEFRPVDPAVAATALLGMEEGLSLLLAVDPQGTRWRESFMLGCQLIIAGLRAPAELLTDHTDDTDQKEEESVSSVLREPESLYISQDRALI
jgi:AcrR family transcriptional regulator